MPPEAENIELFSSFGSDFTVQNHYFIKGFESIILKISWQNVFKKTFFFKFNVSKSGFEIGGGSEHDCSDCIIEFVRPNQLSATSKVLADL